MRLGKLKTAVIGVDKKTGNVLFNLLQLSLKSNLELI